MKRIVLDYLLKKTDKIPKSEIERAEKIREKYFNEKTIKK